MYYQERVSLERQIILGAVEGIIITDQHAVIQNVNPTFTELFGYTEEEVVGKTPQLLRSDKHDDAFFQDMWKSLQQQGFWEGEVWNKTKDGDVKREFLTISHVTNQAGEIKYYVGRFYDYDHAAAT